MAAENLSVNVYSYGKVEPLLTCSLLSVVNNLKLHIGNIYSLPVSLKDRLLFFMSKRGLITDENIECVISDRMKILDLSESDVSDIALSKLNQGQQLRKIDLNSAKESRTSITSAGIQNLANSCQQLQIVFLRRCLNLTDNAILALSDRCPQLRELNIGGCCKITDKSPEALGQKCRFLKCINLSKTMVTDNGIISLASGCCSNVLKEIHMDGCINLTDEAIEAVLNFCPNVSILLFHNCPNITEKAREALEEMVGRSTQMKQITWTIY